MTHVRMKPHALFGTFLEGRGFTDASIIGKGGLCLVGCCADWRHMVTTIGIRSNCAGLGFCSILLPSWLMSSVDDGGIGTRVRHSRIWNESNWNWTRMNSTKRCAPFVWSLPASQREAV